MKKFTDILTLMESTKDLSAFSDQIKKATDRNDHMFTRIFMAKLIGDKRLIEVVQSINNIIDYENNNPISKYTYEIYKKMNILGRKKFGEENWDKNIYQYT